MAKAKTVAKKVTKKVSKPTAKRTSPKKVAKPAQIRTLRVAKADPFFTVKITRQTVYWTILILFIIFIQLWILKTQLDVSATIESLPTRP